MALARAIGAVFVALSAMMASVQAAQAQSLIRDAEIEAMLNEFTTPILVAAGLDPRAVDVYIVADPSMNAFVTGGQNIFLHTGIILEAETPNELKSVIAHEAGHIAGAHLARQAEGARAAYGPMLATMAAGILAAAAGEGGAGAALIASGQQFGMLSFFQYTQAAEATADQAAVQYMEATGQSAEGLIAFFERFRYQEVLSERRDPYFRTHPLSSNRVLSLREVVASQSNYGKPDPIEHQVALERAKAKIRGFMESPRRTFQRYPIEDTSIPAVYARSVAHHKSGALRDALVDVDDLIAREPENAHFHELKGQILFENGRAREAVPHYEEAVRLAPNEALMRMGLAQALIDGADDQRLDEAMEHLRIMLVREPNNSFAWYLRSRVHEAQGDLGLAKLAIAERHYFSDPPRSRAFAMRAREELDRGTPEHLRASDIIVALEASDAIRGARRR